MLTFLIYPILFYFFSYVFIRCCRLKIENDNYRQHVPLDNCKEKDYQVECLRHMIRACEDALIKERMNLQKTKAKKIDHYKKLNNQVCLIFS